MFVGMAAGFTCPSGLPPTTNKECEKWQEDQGCTTEKGSRRRSLLTDDKQEYCCCPQGDCTLFLPTPDATCRPMTFCLLRLIACQSTQRQQEVCAEQC